MYKVCQVKHGEEERIRGKGRINKEEDRIR